MNIYRGYHYSKDTEISQIIFLPIIICLPSQFYKKYPHSILSMRVSQFGYDAYRDGGRKTVRKTWQIIIQSVKTDFLFSLMILRTD